MGGAGRQVALCVHDCPLGDGVQRRPEVPILFDERKNQFAQGTEGGLDVDQGPLAAKLVKERGGSRGGCGHRVHLGVAFAGIAGLAVGTRFKAQAGVAGVGRGLGLGTAGIVGGGILILRRVRVSLFKGLEPLKVLAARGAVKLKRPVGLAFFAPLLGDLGLHTRVVAIPIGQLKRGVALELLFDALLQLGERHLEDFHRLDHPRGQPHVLAELHVLGSLEFAFSRKLTNRHQLSLHTLAVPGSQNG